MSIELTLQRSLQRGLGRDIERAIAAPPGGGGDNASMLDDLIFWLEMNDASNSTRVDSSANGYDAADTNSSVVQAVGTLGNAAEFDGGSSDELVITKANAPELFPSDSDIMFAGWFYLETIANNCGYFSTYDFTNGYALYTPPGDNLLRWNVAGTEITYAPPTTTWFHVAAYHDSVNNEIGMVINDGTPITSAHAGGVNADLSALPNYKIGNMFIGAYGPDARIDGLCAWSRLLTGSELTAHAAGLAYPG